MGVGSTVLKASSMILRVLQFLAAIVILGIFSYFLVYLRDNGIPTLTWVRAVEGLSGAAALYTLIAFFLVCCLGGLPLFAFAGIVLDVVFAACFIAVAVLTNAGNTNCSDITSGESGLYQDPNQVVEVDVDTARRICSLFKATFVLAIIELILFVVSAGVQFGIGRAHQRDKRNGISGSSARPTPFWRRKRNLQREMEQGAVPTK